MTTSHDSPSSPSPSDPSSPSSTAPGERVPLRVRLGEHPGRDGVDGGWWPQSRDLAVELADLVDHLPAEAGRVVRALYSPPDWDHALRRVPLARGYVKTGSFPRDDTRLMQLRMLDGTVLRIVVVPSSMSAEQGEQALLAASTTGNTETAVQLLDTVDDSPPSDAADHW